MIVVAPLHEVEEAIRIWRPSHVVGLASPGAETARLPENVERLHLTFHDIAEPREGLQPVTEADIDRLLAFADGWPRTAPLLIQCWAGVSRSPAAAYAVACAVRGPGEEAALAAALRQAAPFATPNRRLVALADAALGLEGRMIEAVAAIGRGAETSTGATFILSVV
jgi:predicted protein tyrosine phosphatase